MVLVQVMLTIVVFILQAKHHCGVGLIGSTSDASEGDRAMKLSWGTTCVGQTISNIESGTYELSCDIKKPNNKYADVGLFADGAELNTKEIGYSSNFQTITIRGYVAPEDNYLSVYFYKDGLKTMIVDNCSLVKVN